MRTIVRLLIGWSLALGTSVTAQAQGTDTVRTGDAVPSDDWPWSARIGYGRDAFQRDDPAWSDWTQVEAALGRRFRRGALVVSAARVERFGEEAVAVGADAYRELGSRRYGNLRVVVAPGTDIVPRMDVAGELYHGLGGGWEPSIGYRYMSYAGDDVQVASVALGRFAGDEWYARARASFAWGVWDGGASAGATLRRYMGSTQEFVELLATVGVEAVHVPRVGSPAVETRKAWGVATRAQRFVTAMLGAAGTIGYERFESMPDRVSVGIGIVGRWR